jgi:hypothetical protein
VIATDQHGRPALIANTLGKGKTLLCAYPIESYLAVQAAAFEGDENTHRFYRAFRQWAGITPLFQTDQPSVEVGALTGPERGYAILASHSPEVQKVTVTSRLPVRSIRLITPTGTLPLDHKEGDWQLTLEGYDGAIVEWNV